MTKQTTLHRKRETLQVYIKNLLPDLVSLKKENNREAFTAELLTIIPQLKSYIIPRIHSAIKKNHFPKNMYLADDFINQLFIEVYDHIEEFDNEDEFYVWLYKKLNELLDDAITEEEFDDYFFKNMDDYTTPEWQQMEERFYAKSDGDLVMKEDLNDISFYREPYTLKDVFITDNERELTDKIDAELQEQDIDRHIQLVLHNLSRPIRNVFELFTKQHLTIKEIVVIQNQNSAHISNLLDDAYKILKMSFFNRYASE